MDFRGQQWKQGEQIGGYPNGSRKNWQWTLDKSGNYKGGKSDQIQAVFYRYNPLGLLMDCM